MSVQPLDDAIWAVLAVVALTLIGLSFRSGPPVARLSATIRRLSGNRVAFGALMLGWAWLGWHSFAR